MTHLTLSKPSKGRRLFLWVLWGTLLLPAGARAGEEWKAKLSVTVSTQTHFEWINKTPPVLITARDDRLEALATLEGSYSQKTTKLLIVDEEKKANQISINSDGKFTIPVILTGEATTVRLLAITPDGALEREEVTLLFPGWKKFQETEGAQLQEELKSKNRAFYHVSLGLTSASYQEGTRVNYSALATTFKASYIQTIFPPNWDLGVNAFFTLSSLASNLPNTSVQFLGVNLRFGYVLPQIKSPWRMSVLGGIYYTRMFVAKNAFGIKDVTYPQIFPTIRRIIDPGRSVMGYLKYVPTGSGIGLSWKEKELAIGGGYEHLLKNHHPLSVSLDISDFAMENSINGLMHLNTVTVSVGYGL